MKKIIYQKVRWFFMLLSALLSHAAISQDSKFGYQLPTEGTVRVLLVFAEIVQNGNCAGAQYNPSDPAWLTGPAAPPNADNYLDPFVISNYNTHISRYYKESSLGELNVLGDYFDRTVQVPCNLFSQLGNASAVQQLNTELMQNGITTTKHGLTIDDFDDYQWLNNGIYKPAGNPDGKIDATVIIWRNHPTYTCGSGLGIANVAINQSVYNKTSYMYGAWDGCPSNWANSYENFFIIEYFHSMFGGNNFHTGGGASNGTFMFDALGTYSTTAQAGSSSQVANGWDRNFMGWKGNRTYQISALDQANTEVVSDITIATHPNTTFFVLRDYVTEGDAVRIKLPHLNWTTSGDNKNQYLWIENHQVGRTGSGEFDINKGCVQWAPGLYMYLQVGKDILSGTNLYNGAESTANSLKDWFFPMSAEGNYDYFYEYSTKNINNLNCAWGNASLPYSKFFTDGTTKPNPFTGYNDQWGRIDSNQDGIYNAADTWQPTFQKYLGIPNGSPPNPTIPVWGDNLDAFTTTGQKISIGTNPSTATVYTNRQASNAPFNFDNQTVRLNNLSVSIVNDNFYNETDPNAKKAFLICIKWDDKDIAQDVRWCGNITAANDVNDPALRNTQINVLPNKKITLDRGLSPTKLTSTLIGTTYYFNDPTCLHLLSGSTTTLQSGASIHVINGSFLHVASGANLIIGPNATINVDATSQICIEPGANVTFQSQTTSKIIVNGIAYSNIINLVNVTLANAPTNYHAYTSISTSGSTIMPTAGPVVLEAGQAIVMGPNTRITPSNSGNPFRAFIGTPINCAGYPPLENGVLQDRHDTEAGIVLDTGMYAFMDDIWTIQYPYLLGTWDDEIDGENFAEELSIYPNPSNQIFNIKCPKYDLIETVTVRNMAGQVILIIDNTTEKETHKIQFKLNGVSSGMYLVEIKCEKETVMKRIVLNE